VAVANGFARLTAYLRREDAGALVGTNAEIM
jgi:hypothetical protein